MYTNVNLKCITRFFACMRLSKYHFVFIPEQELSTSRVHVKTRMTTVGHLIKSSTPDATAKPPSPTPQVDASEPIIYEGWHKHWEVESAHGNITPNLKWMHGSLEHGLFHPGKAMKNKDGVVVERKVLKDRMVFNPPPLPVSMMGSVPSMLSFFTTPVFFWRPVGVMKAKVRCPNSNCPGASKPDAYLIRKGYGSTARRYVAFSHTIRY